MPLSPPVSRSSQHERRINGQGFLRDDGLWDIDVTLTDHKTYAFDNQDFGSIEANQPYHSMALRMTVDESLLVISIEAHIDASPYRICPQVSDNFKRLEGERIGRGWGKRVKELVGRTEGCRHLRDMLDTAVVVAFQTILARRVEDVASDSNEKPPHLDQCFALATDGEVVKRDYPQWFIGSDTSKL